MNDYTLSILVTDRTRTLVRDAEAARRVRWARASKRRTATQSSANAPRRPVQPVWTPRPAA